MASINILFPALLFYDAENVVTLLNVGYGCLTAEADSMQCGSGPKQNVGRKADSMLRTTSVIRAEGECRPKG